MSKTSLGTEEASMVKVYNHTHTAEDILDKDNFLIAVIFNIWSQNNNQQIRRITNETNIKWLFALNNNKTSICYKIDSGVQHNVIPENQIKSLQTKPKITESITTLAYTTEAIYQ